MPAQPGSLLSLNLTIKIDCPKAMAVLVIGFLCMAPTMVQLFFFAAFVVFAAWAAKNIPLPEWVIDELKKHLPEGIVNKVRGPSVQGANGNGGRGGNRRR
eukprot:TRINITY_DN61813_c0_g1_i1.p2 TRINITY_DN61813_c0_g1~~TRINITY_DN61813_c0_g1_i1.p2  ORF type:complete len:100 (+),score=34.69 TRINITY_DN61813_c0_g1_i1:82-381(+)